MIDSGARPLILDARSPLAREAEPRTIPGAVVIDLNDVEQVIGAVPPDRDVVVYCS
jgi:rhodanese-related sulfurtransferase